MSQSLTDDLSQECEMMLQPSHTDRGVTFLLGSLSHRLAYVRLPKCGSTLITRALHHQFPDLQRIPLTKLRDASWFIFTFVRDPVSLAVAGYAEIEAHAWEAVERFKPPPLLSTLRYYRLPRRDSHRFPLFLDELFAQKFGPNCAANLWPAHAYPMVVNLGSALLRRVNFIGRLDTAIADWRRVQVAEAQSALKSGREPALGQISGSIFQKQQRNVGNVSARELVKAESKAGVMLSDKVLCKISRLYAVDFACL
eukprot:gene25780-31539_t